jgi:serine protease Do
MQTWKTGILTAALAGAAAAGSALTPVAHGQTVTRARTPPRAVTLLARGGQLGVSIRDITDDDAKGKSPAASGAIVDEVSEDSAAAKAGIKKGDTIVEFDGERVRSARQLARLVQETAAYRKTTVAIMRDGQRMNLTVELTRETQPWAMLNGDRDLFESFGNDVRRLIPPVRPAAPAPPAPPAAPAPPAPPAFPDMGAFIWRFGNTLGMTVGDLSSQLATYFGTKSGALVTSVSDDSAAAKAGVKAGDVITSFNGSTIESPSDLRRRTQRLEDGEEFSMGVVREKKTLTLKGKADAQRARRSYRTIL